MVHFCICSECLRAQSRCVKHVLSPLIMLLPWSREKMSGAEGPRGMLRAPGLLLSEFPSFVDAVREGRAFLTSPVTLSLSSHFLHLPPSPINCSEDVTDNYNKRLSPTRKEKRLDDFLVFFLLPSRPLAWILVLGSASFSQPLAQTSHTSSRDPCLVSVSAT